MNWKVINKTAGDENLYTSFEEAKHAFVSQVKDYQSKYEEQDFDKGIPFEIRAALMGKGIREEEYLDFGSLLERICSLTTKEDKLNRKTLDALLPASRQMAFEDEGISYDLKLKRKRDEAVIDFRFDEDRIYKTNMLILENPKREYYFIHHDIIVIEDAESTYLLGTKEDLELYLVPIPTVRPK